MQPAVSGNLFCYSGWYWFLYLFVCTGCTNLRSKSLSTFYLAICLLILCWSRRLERPIIGKHTSISVREQFYTSAVRSSLPAICDFLPINQPPQSSLHLSSNCSALSLKRYIVSTISSLRYIKQSTVFNEYTRGTKAVSRSVYRVYSSSLVFIYALTQWETSETKFRG